MDSTPETVEDFANFLLDEDRTEFTFVEADRVARGLGLSVATSVIRQLKGYGFTMASRVEPPRVRGFLTSSHDRFYGPGSCPTHGGSGWEQIAGFAGRAG